MRAGKGEEGEIEPLRPARPPELLAGQRALRALALAADAGAEAPECDAASYTKNGSGASIATDSVAGGGLSLGSCAGASRRKGSGPLPAPSSSCDRPCAPARRDPDRTRPPGRGRRRDRLAGKREQREVRVILMTAHGEEAF